MAAERAEDGIRHHGERRRGVPVLGKDHAGVEGHRRRLRTARIPDLELELTAPAGRRPVTDDLRDGALDGSCFMHGSSMPNAMLERHLRMARRCGSGGTDLRGWTARIVGPVTDPARVVAQLDATWFGSGLSASLKAGLAVMSRE